MRTKVIGDQFIEIASTESTNKTAAELLSLSKLRHGAVILAHEQTAGKGQRGRVWHSEAGLDLTFSIVVEPAGLHVAEQFVLSKLIALAVHDIVQARVQGDVRIKWPNDILVDRRKVAGILIQNELQGERLTWSVIGVGLNVNSTEFPDVLMATSLAVEAGHSFERTKVLEDLCIRFETRWEKWGQGVDPAADYTDLLWSAGRWVEMDLDDERVLVRPMDVDRTGRLIIEHGDGKVGAYGLDKLRFAPR